MKNLTSQLLIVIVAIAISFQSFSQDKIDSNLKYINDQFKLYNTYKTKFMVDRTAKLIVFSNEFGTNTISISNLGVDVDKNNFFRIYCLSGNKCINKVDKEGRTQNNYYDEYTMRLEDNGVTISNIKTVVEKLLEIKEELIGDETVSSTTSSNTEVDLDAEIAKINKLCQQYAQYKNVYSLDLKNKLLSYRTESCYVTFPLNTKKRIEYKENTSYYYYFYSDTKDIGHDCSSFNEKVDVSSSSVNNYDAVLEIVKSLKLIAETVYNMTDETSSSTSDDDDLDEEIEKINKLCQEHSEYKNVWSLDKTTYVLTYKTTNCTVTFPLNTKLRIEYKLNDYGTYSHTYYFYSDTKEIGHDCTSFNEKVGVSSSSMDSYEAATEMVRRLKIIADTVYEMANK